MLQHISRAQVEAIIAAAEAVNAKVPHDGPGIRLSEVDRIIDYYHSSERLGLDQQVAELSQKARTELKALMWLGRGDTDNFAEAVENARGNSNDDDVTYITEKAPALPEYLRRALNRNARALLKSTRVA